MDPSNVELPSPKTLKDRLTTAGIWVLLLGMAWSLPVIDYVADARERAKMESGHYYTPKMPAEWYVQQGAAPAPAPSPQGDSAQ